MKNEVYRFIFYASFLKGGESHLNLLYYERKKDVNDRNNI